MSEIRRPTPPTIIRITPTPLISSPETVASTAQVSIAPTAIRIRLTPTPIMGLLTCPLRICFSDERESQTATSCYYHQVRRVRPPSSPANSEITQSTDKGKPEIRQSPLSQSSARKLTVRSPAIESATYAGRDEM